MEHTYTMPRYIKDEDGIYEFITLIYTTFKNTTNSKIVLDFSATYYINPNLMAPLGLILTKLKSQNNEIFLSKMRSSIQRILIKYGFVQTSHINVCSIMQNYIKYENFNGDNAEGFENYLNNQLNDISNKHVVSTLISYLMEIFVNVKTHARQNENRNRYKNKEIFTSGYYNQSQNYIRFSIANNGKTFISTINRSLNYNFAKEVDSIKWALKEKNTSKKNAPGGLGLYMLYDLVKITKGELIILSGKGYYQISYSNKISSFIVNTKDFTSPFPGTVVTVLLPLDLIPESKAINNNLTFDALSLLEGVI